MDSGANSGSMQSSSGGVGGDEEYNSRPFFSPITHLGSTSSSTHHQQQQHHHHHQELSFLLHQQQPTFFDPSSFHAFSQSLPNPNPLPNPERIHSRALRFDGSNTDDPLPSVQQRSLYDSNVRSSASSGQNNHNNNESAPRNPKKRTRASRKAPTTVLTTDTSNFRAMVQEFTGIPAPPFMNTPSYSRRLDLFGSALRTGNLDGPVYPLRPSAQKVQQSPLLSPPSSLMLNGNQNLLSFQSILHQNATASVNESASSAKLSQASMDLAASSAVHGLGSASFSGGLTNQDHQVRSSTSNFDGNYSSLNNGCKFNFSGAPTSDLLSDKGLVADSVGTSTRGAHEGTVDSWICSSD